LLRLSLLVLALLVQDTLQNFLQELIKGSTNADKVIHSHNNRWAHTCKGNLVGQRDLARTVAARKRLDGHDLAVGHVHGLGKPLEPLFDFLFMTRLLRVIH